MPALVQDERLPVISFTGSGPVGYAIMDSVPRKHFTLELGGNGAAVVLADYATDADLDWAATRIATFSNYQGGQSCISVQRVIADASVYDRLRRRIVAAVEAPGHRRPDRRHRRRPAGQRGRRQARREWVEEAVEAGATLLTGGNRDGASYAPTVLADVPADATISCEEVFGPVLSCDGSTARTRRSPPSTTPSTASRRACSPTTCRPPSAPTARWRSAA